MNNEILKAYGLWESPLSGRSLARTARISDVAWDASSTLLWLEHRPQRAVLVVQPPGEHAPRDLNDEYSVRASVGYGGGDFTAGGGHAFFVEADSGRIYRQPLESGRAIALTPAFGACASPRLSPDGQWLLYSHSYEGTDCLAIIDAGGSQWPQKLADGADFFMQPAWSPDSRQVAWVEWDHPNMPWDGTRLAYARWSTGESGQRAVLKKRTLAGDEDTSIMQPEFSPDGRSLAYLSDASGWWQVHIYDFLTGKHQQLTQDEGEIGQPGWVQGNRAYGFTPDGLHIVYLRNLLGIASLWEIELGSGKQRQLSLGVEYQWLEQPAIAPDGRRVALLGSGDRTPQRLLIYTPGQGARIVRRSTAEEVPASAYSTSQPVRWQNPQGGVVFGLYYPPHNPAYRGFGQPPLIVMVHGGPTSQRTAAFDSQAQFFTSRGYAVLQVNYRGSSGYGRAYRNLLRGNWGVYDVEDCVSGARWLIEQGLVDPGKLVIMGGSAGGFTTLKAIQDHPGFFKAGVILYGVANQFSLAMDSHKFEAHYSDHLIGPLPEAADAYRERSPIFFADRIQEPLAIFHGENDKVVSRAQSDELVDSLRKRGIAHVYHVYPGEGHGFRKPETIEHFYQEVERFLRQAVIYGCFA